jgi:hypothetical protein
LWVHQQLTVCSAAAVLRHAVVALRRMPSSQAAAMVSFYHCQRRAFAPVAQVGGWLQLRLSAAALNPPWLSLCSCFWVAVVLGNRSVHGQSPALFCWRGKGKV